jgi:hypothetical protein
MTVLQRWLHPSPFKAKSMALRIGFDHLLKLITLTGVY